MKGKRVAGLVVIICDLLACAGASALPTNMRRDLACPQDNFTGPAWSPDGARIAYSAAFDVLRHSNQDIYTMSPDGGDITRLTNHIADDSAPAWSPDGERIAFVSTRDG